MRWKNLMKHPRRRRCQRNLKFLLFKFICKNSDRMSQRNEFTKKPRDTLAKFAKRPVYKAGACSTMSCSHIDRAEKTSGTLLGGLTNEKHTSQQFIRTLVEVWETWKWGFPGVEIKFVDMKNHRGGIGSGRAKRQGMKAVEKTDLEQRKRGWSGKRDKRVGYGEGFNAGAANRTENGKASGLVTNGSSLFTTLLPLSVVSAFPRNHWSFAFYVVRCGISTRASSLAEYIRKVATPQISLSRLLTVSYLHKSLTLMFDFFL